MGLNICYQVPAAAGPAFTYSVERREDSVFFDFDQEIYLPFYAIPSHDVVAELAYSAGFATAYFDNVEGGKTYMVRIHRSGDHLQAIAALPLVVPHGGYPGSSKGGAHMEPRYKSGKKFINGQAIDALHRYTFYGDDGFTIHTATLWADGTSSCNCPRWIKKITAERWCPHSERVLTLTANLDDTGERPEPPPPAAEHATNPFQRRTRSIDT